MTDNASDLAASGLSTDAAAGREVLLEVKNLNVEFRTDRGVVNAVNGVNYKVREGETVAILGESGSGKSVSAQAIMGIIDSPPGFITEGEVLYRGVDLLTMEEEDRRAIRGAKISMVFQDALSSLNPVFTIGWQLSEMFRIHQGMSKSDAKERSIDLLERVGIPSPEKRVDGYPHEFSGGMRQRAMIAMAIALDPEVLIADEPTTALDVTVQAQIMDLLAGLQEQYGMSMVLITHDLGVVAEVADRVNVMYAGRIVEHGSGLEVFTRPAHPYTVGLMESIPRADMKGTQLTPIVGSPPDLANLPDGCAFHPRCRFRRTNCFDTVPPVVAVPGDARYAACHYTEEVLEADVRVETAEPAIGPQYGVDPLLRVEGLVKHFPIKQGIVFKRTVGHVQAVDGVSFDLYPGETLGLVGESGSGKSTVARTLLRLHEPTGGKAMYEDEDLFQLSNSEMRKRRRDIQMIFQDPYASLNPRMTVRDIVTEGWKIHSGLVAKSDWESRAGDLLERVGLNPDHINRYPHQFSGGQRQRIGVARALALEPKIIVADEPVSALDVSVQAQVINLLEEIQDEFGLSYIFIAHDLSVVRHIADRVAVMYLGRIVEIGTEEEIYERPTHPYTQALLSATPIADPVVARQRPDRILLQGDLPSPSDPPSGCRFRTRCWKVRDECAHEDPALIDRFDHGHPSACLFAEEREHILR